MQAVNIALLLEQPLLVTGEPGTGKTQLAYSIASELNLGEVLRACIALLDTPDMTVEQLMTYIQGPDFSQGGRIIGMDGIWPRWGGITRRSPSWKKRRTWIRCRSLSVPI